MRSSSAASSLARAASARNFERREDLIQASNQEEGLRFISEREPGLRCVTSLIFHREAKVAPTHEECLEELKQTRSDIAEQICAIWEPLLVEPQFKNGKYTYIVDLYRRRTGILA